jgi:hypothetical protein
MSATKCKPDESSSALLHGREISMSFAEETKHAVKKHKSSVCQSMYSAIKNKTRQVRTLFGEKNPLVESSNDSRDYQNILQTNNPDVIMIVRGRSITLYDFNTETTIDLTGPVECASMRYMIMHKSGMVYFSSDKHVIYTMHVDGTNLKIFCGQSDISSYINGDAKTNHLTVPNGIAFDSKQSLLICDTGNNRVRNVNIDGYMTDWAGNGIDASIDGKMSVASFRSPRSICLDGIDNAYICDNGGIRFVSFSGIVSTIPDSYTITSRSFMASMCFNRVSGVLYMIGTNCVYALTTSNSSVSVVAGDRMYSRPIDSDGPCDGPAIEPVKDNSRTGFAQFRYLHDIVLRDHWTLLVTDDLYVREVFLVSANQVQITLMEISPHLFQSSSTVFSNWPPGLLTIVMQYMF